MNDAQLMMKFLELYHKKDIQELKKKTTRSALLIDFQELNDFFQEHQDKSLFRLNFQQLLMKCENKINEKRQSKQRIALLLTDIPENIELKNLDSDDNGKFISTTAMIKNISEIKTNLKTAIYECRSCMKLYDIDVGPDEVAKVPTYCMECGGKSFNLLREHCDFRNVRYVRLEEPLELRQGGRTRDFKACMEGYLASPEHKIKAGDVCNISGKFEVVEVDNKSNNQNFDFLITLHNIMPVDSSFEDFYISESDEEEILDLSHEQNLFQKFVDSLAPEVYGYESVKKGIVLQLFEGLRPQEDGSYNDEDRWTIHILLIGDPGIGKSKILTSVAKVAPKCITINGAGTTSAGLTSAAVKDEFGTWSLEAGAVVLADSGLLNIDEFDKLTTNVQLTLNEPMENLSVSEAKAGLVQNMTARTSVLAGANPKGSRFSDFENFKKQLDIPDSTLSRFDLVFALRDTINEQTDRELAENIIKKTFKQKRPQESLIEETLFKKYINYAKTHCFPKLSEEAQDLLIDTYVSVRQEAKENEDTKPITSRDLKCIERLSVARAKVELRDTVTLQDAQEAVQLYRESLETIGLDLQSAGVKSDVVSDAEFKIIKEAEETLKTYVEEYGLKIPNNIRKELIMEFNLETYGNSSISGEEVYKKAMDNILEDYM